MATRILIVDDESHIRDNLQEILESKGYIVDKASTKNEAISCICQNKPNYTIIDLKLDTTSDYGGIKLYQDIMQSDPDIRLLILSAFPFEGDVIAEFRKIFQGDNTIENLLKDVENNYICKGGEQNYLRTVLKRLK